VDGKRRGNVAKVDFAPLPKDGKLALMRTLVIGYGNPSRRDDGVALAVVNGLRRRLNLPALDETQDGFDDLGGALDTLFLQQLGPELAETLSGYEQVIFVDAHVGTYPEPVRRVALAAQAGPAIVSHHMKPGQLLALAARLYGRAPGAELISVRGFDFDFGATLSPGTAVAAESVVDDVWRRYHS
jgi:hydrogenase maturation protease